MPSKGGLTDTPLLPEIYLDLERPRGYSVIPGLPGSGEWWQARQLFESPLVPSRSIIFRLKLCRRAVRADIYEARSFITSSSRKSRSEIGDEKGSRMQEYDPPLAIY